jgi:hypothetical protein
VGGVCSTNGEKRKAYNLLVRKPEGKRTLGRPRRKWVNNIKMGLLEAAWIGVSCTVWLWIGTRRVLVNVVMKFRVP